MERKVHKIDASDQAPGRLASRIAILLRGKNKPTYRPHVDEGDIVEVTNADKIKVTGKKLIQKNYYRASQYPGGLKTIPMWRVKEKNPGEIIIRAVKQMLPATKLRPGMMKRLIIK
jgi:large subunit ribosomal protein L13